MNQQEKPERLQKVLSRAGFGSRRGLEQWITAGRVSINGRIAKLGDVVAGGDVIRVDGRRLSKLRLEAGAARVLAYYKPVGVLATRSDPQGRPTVFDQIPFLARGRWVSVGRLDVNSSGLLLFTTHGELANRLMHPSFEIEREYAVRVFGQVGEEILAGLQRGVMLAEGPAKFDSVVAAGGDNTNRWFHVTLRRGRNREVRRLWESQGIEVSRLIRTRYGNIILPRGKRRGDFWNLEPQAVNALAKLVDLDLSLPEKPRYSRRR